MDRFKVNALILLSFLALLALITVSVYGQQRFGRGGERGGSKSDSKQNYDPSQAVVISGDVTARSIKERIDE